MRDETKALLKRGKDSKTDGLAPDELMAEVLALNTKIRAALAHIGGMRDDHSLVDAVEDDDDIRGSIYELGAKLGGIYRVGEEAIEKNLGFLNELRRLGRLVDRLDDRHDEEKKAARAAAAEAARIAAAEAAAAAAADAARSMGS